MPEAVAHYTLLERIGSGTLGPLHRARDGKTGRTVALRLVSKDISGGGEARDRLQLALQRAARLSHPNIASFYDVGEHDGHLFYAQEFVPGALLSSQLVDPLNPRRAAGYAAEIADALAELEAADLQHGHVGAGAVMITPKGRAKLLLDAGFAAALTASAKPAPDMAGLGHLIALMVTGADRGRPLPPELAPIVQRCLDGGYDSAVLAAAELRAVVDSLELRTVAVPAAPAARTTERSKTWLWLVLALLLVGAVAVIWLAVST
jgi:serine/threonine protein kinase